MADGHVPKASQKRAKRDVRRVEHDRHICREPGPATPSILFVIAAHVADVRNCAILANTLASIGCHHPGEAILIVDNASPSSRAVESSIAESGIGTRAALLRIAPENFSRGQLGSWAAADRFLQDQADLAVGQLRERLSMVALLQHSTPLAAPLRLPSGCEAAALSTLVDGTNGGLWMASNESGMKWASAVAEAAQMDCAPPCTRGLLPQRLVERRPDPGGGMGTASVEHAFEWAAAAHGVLALSSVAWKGLLKLRLWPSGPNGAQQPALRPLAQLWSSRPCAPTCWRGECWRGVRGVLPCHGDGDVAVNVGLINGGMEKLAGILLAYLNLYSLPLDGDRERRPAAVSRGGARGPRTSPTSRPTAACYIQDAVHKIHGGNLRPDELARRRASSAHGGNATESRSAGAGGLAEPTPLHAWSCRRSDATGAHADALYLPE